MKEMGSREFQLNYQRVSEPVKVVSQIGGKILGYFYPGDVPPTLGEQPGLFPDKPEPGPDGDEDTRLVAHGSVDDDLEGFF